MTHWRQSLAIVRYFGWRWVLWRTGFAVRRRTGLLRRRFPVDNTVTQDLTTWVKAGVPVQPAAYAAYRAAEERAVGGPRFFFAAGEPPAADTLSAVVDDVARDRLVKVADDFCAGRFLFYSHHVHDLGIPVDWLRNPFNGAQHEAATHWCDYPAFRPERGDIKDVWEPSRFAFIYWLVRAYALTGDERYGHAFWDLVESWTAQNPLNRGPNWKCGQETALRAMALCFGLYGLRAAAATTPQRLAGVVSLLAAHAARIAGNIDYAVSQGNNHALSEATGLLTVGLLFPELRAAAAWTARGRAILEREVQRQIYADGSYVQHSMNYHRVMLQVMLWARRLADLNGRPLCAAATDRFDQAAAFMFEMLDPESGGVPNYGANDGALVLPLTSCDYRDFRPVIQASMYAVTAERVLPAGRWDESLLWLFGAAAREAPLTRRTPQSRHFADGGYVTLRSDQGWCLLRCHSYRDRPVHVDPLHVDFWWRGVNWFGDSGSYRYYDPGEPRIERYFKGIAAHNTIELDAAEPLELVSRFLWLPWPAARLVRVGADEIIGEHYAYERAPWRVVHRRRVSNPLAGVWTITDEVLGRGQHRIALRWHLADDLTLMPTGERVWRLAHGSTTVNLGITAPASMDTQLLRGVSEGEQVAGWRSDYYGRRVPRDTLECSGLVELPMTLVTHIDCRMDVT